MKQGVFMVCLFLSCQSMALTTIYAGEKTISSDQYLKPNQRSAPINLRGSADISPRPGLPAKSQLQAGEFDSYRLPQCQKYPTPFFVIGGDGLSTRWLKAHSHYLKEVHAFGLITNIAQQKDLKRVERLSPIALIPSNVDGLAQVVNTPRYPFFTNGCEVWQ